MAGVFDGVKVLEFAWILAGPLTSGYLAKHGATVLRVESTNQPDLLRTSAPFKDGKPGFNRGGNFANVNPNKYSMTLNLNHPSGIEVARRLVAWADVVSENFAPGRMEQWGLSYEELKKVKPDVIMMRNSNQGQTGPQAARRGFGILLASQVGFNAFTGWPDRWPNTSYLGYTDFVAPRFAAAALIAALIHRRNTGEGQCLDISQGEAGLQMLAPALLDYIVNGRKGERTGNSSACAAPHGAYACKGEDRWCAISVSTDQEWNSFCRAVGGAEWTTSPMFSTLLERKRNEDELNRLVTVWTRERTAEEVMRLMQQAGVPAGVVQNTRDLAEDPQLKSRDYLWCLEHEEMGLFPHQGPSIVFSKTPAEPRMPAPCLGEHTEFACREFLRMPEEEFVTLLADGVFE